MAELGARIVAAALSDYLADRAERDARWGFPILAGMAETAAHELALMATGEDEATTQQNRETEN